MNEKNLPQSNSCTSRYNTARENETQWFGATPINPPMAPFCRGGGPQDRGIFVSNRHFHKRGAEDTEKRN
jgi:hypothetical protein